LIFICGFCRGEGEKGFHGDDFLKGSVRWSRSTSTNIITTTPTKNEKNKRKIMKKVQ
jgi:hypothetical protein